MTLIGSDILLTKLKKSTVILVNVYHLHRCYSSYAPAATKIVTDIKINSTAFFECCDNPAKTIQDV